MSDFEGIPMGDLTDSPPPSPGATAETTTTTTPNTASATTTTTSKKRGRESETSSSQSSTSSFSSAPSPASQSYFPPPPPPPPPSFQPPPPPPSPPSLSSLPPMASANSNNNNKENGNKDEDNNNELSFREQCGLLATQFTITKPSLADFFRAAGGTPCGDIEGAMELLWYENGVMRWQPEPEGWSLWSQNHVHYCTFTEMEGILLGPVAVWEGEEEGEIW